MIIINFLLVLNAASQIANYQCKRENITSQYDCERYFEGQSYWNSTTCLKNETAIDPGTSETNSDPTYCNLISITECAQNINCALINDECWHFTGCSVFLKENDQECQSISKRCISDGSQCVEVGQCDEYLNQKSCQYDENGEFCYWDSTNSKCIIAFSCEYLPKSLSTDELCRDELSTCTVASNGKGCIESGQNCSDQLFQNQCIWNRDKTQQCYWNGTNCVDKICQNALNTLITDEQCINFFSKCTTKQNGGCVDRTTCDANLIQEACKKNQNGGICYWNGTKCLDKICKNAPSTYKTNNECKQFLSNCITNGNGCVDNNNCNSATIENSCESDLSNNKCVWSNNTCQVAQCSLAPNSLTSNLDCQGFLMGCVTKDGGGCMKISKCSAYNIEEACVIDIDGNYCFWDDNKCIDKTCQNAPQSLSSHQDCQNYSEDCTVNPQTNQGCVDMTCENIQDQELCIVDFKEQKCIYEESCSSKECSLAKLTSALECNKYLDECTLNDEGTGCTLLPPTCRGNSKKENCLFRINGECGWDSQKNICVDKSCYTADASLNTNDLCGSYLKGCVVSNTIGCMVLPKLCADRKKEENCHFDDADDCIWGLDQCQSRSCQTAIFELETINMQECNQYIDCSEDITKCCILNNDNDNCQNKSICDELNKSNCVKDAAIKGSCQWNGIKCIDADSMICTDYFGKSHQECNDLKNTCTVNSTLDGCIDLKKCEEYENQSQCKINSDKEFCLWESDSCKSYTCSDAPDSYDYQTDEQCGSFQSNCTVRPDIGGCVDKFETCQDYKKEESCVKTQGSTKIDCLWYNNECRSIKLCENINFLPSYTTTSCESISFECKVNLTNDGCINKICTDYAYSTLDDCKSIDNCSINKSQNQCIPMKDYCSEYINQDYCYYSKIDGPCIQYKEMCVKKNYQCYFMTGTEITCPTYREACYYNPNTGNCARKICQVRTPPKTTLADCQDFDTDCTAQIDQEQCTDIVGSCNGYSDMNLCYYSKAGYCILGRYDGRDICQDVYQIETCSQIRYNYKETCEKLDKTCTDNPDKTSLQQCVDKTCSNAVKSEYTHSTCQAWLSKCTSNQKGTGCQDYLTNCSDYTQSNCAQSKEGRCEIVNNQCVLRKCDYSPSTLQDNQVCESYLSTCTVGRIGGCEVRKQTCDLYELQKQCYFDINNNRCWWNPTDKKCVQLKCSNIEQTDLYSTNEQCKSIKYIDCILSNTLKGCQDNQQQCESFTSEKSCNVDLKGQPCQWKDDKCYTKTCTSAPNSLITLEQCLSYYTKIKCTTKTGGGCTFQLDTCDAYTDQGSCIITKRGVLCGFDEKNKKCAIKSCQTAPLSYSSHKQCNTYIDTCTVQVSGSGCQTIPNTCEEMIMIQCELNYCYYDSDSSSCKTKTCQNKPESISDCTEYLNECFLDPIKCKTAICENYFYPTDQECRNILPNCTSDGNQCIPRKLCIQSFNEASCVTQPDGQLCQWNSQNQCVIRSCVVAPKNLTTHSQCQQYINSCTTQKNGGCISLMSCIEYTFQEQCQIDKFQQKCVWDTTINHCRDQECQDQSGQNHKQCQAISSECTADYVRKGYCMDLLQCSMYDKKLHCIIGTDGSCLWIKDQCYQYSQCEDIPFKTHEECQQISEDCTTDGNQCVPITFCKNTNTNGGCVLGIDGECIQIVENGINSCTQFESCKQIAYSTHYQCYQAKNDCTSDGVTCISLNDCDKYNSQIACVINKEGKIISSKRILSTGRCVWDSTTNQCRDQSCYDLSGTTNDQCQSQLYSCTSDGKICVPKFNCNTLTNQTQCLIAKSEEGYCFWSNNTCDVIGCVNITNATSIEKCKDQNSKCTYDGQQCITISQCKDYKTKTSCNSGGTDGYCSWIPQISTNVTTTVERNKCELMKSCEQANLDQNSCLQVKDLCYFKKATNTSSSQCLEHSCLTYYEQNNICSFFYNWNKTLITLCQLQNNKCQNITAPTTLNQKDCYLLSGYTYTYNTSTSNCQSCSPPRNNVTVQPKFIQILNIFLISLLIFI